MPAEGPDAVETPGTASPPPSSPPLPTSLAPDDDARARSLAEADALSETLRVLAEATDALPEGALAKTRVLAAKFRLRSAKAHTLETSAAPESVPSSDWNPSENLASSSEGAFAPPKERAERLFAAELRRSRAVADAVAETVSFWALLENDENTATRLLHAALCVALRGNEDIQFDGARKFAARYATAKVGETLSPSRMHVAANLMIQFQSSVSFGAGFVTGLGGLLTLPVTLPANVAANMVTNLRLAFAVAVVGGHDPMRPSVAAAAIAAALGLTEETDVCSFVSRVKGDDVVRGAAAHLDDGTSEEDGTLDDERESPAEKTKRREALEKRKRKTTIDRERSKRLIDRSVADGAARAALRGNAAVLQGTAWRMARTAAARLATKGATRTTGVAAARAIPFLGGFVGGGVDAAAAVAAGGRAMRRFLPPKPPVDFDRSSPAPLAVEFQKLSDSASLGVERLGNSFASAFRGASAAVSGAFESAAETLADRSPERGRGGNEAPLFDNHVDGHCANASPSYQAGGFGSAKADARGDADAVDASPDGFDFDVFSESEARWEREAARLAAARAEAMARRAEALDAARRRLETQDAAGETTRGDAPGSNPARSDSEVTRRSRRARRWARHESRWLAFARDEDATSTITHDDVPWPPSAKRMLAAAADAEMVDDTDEDANGDDATRKEKRRVATRRAYRRLVLRWHSDKFAARFSARLDDADADLVMARVGELSRAVVEQWTQFTREP
jgi:hypothetical protein